VEPQVCVLSAPEPSGKRSAVCKLPDQQDDVVTSGNDSASFFDVAPTDSKAGDAKGAETSQTDAVDAVIAPDVVDVGPTGTILHQACFQTHCPLQLQNCLKSSTCIAAMNNAIDCVATCQGGQGCVVQCQNFLAADTLAAVLASCGSSLLICGYGCGDGECEANETPITCPGDCKMPVTGSCQGYCFGKSPDGCFCDKPCATQGDCCPDKVALCGP
jgi:hypothetical protein